MQFDVIIGNPPYQLDDGGGGGTSAAPDLPAVRRASQERSIPRYLCMVMPSRWFAGGKGLDEFRERMLADNRMRKHRRLPEALRCLSGCGDSAAASATSSGIATTTGRASHDDLGTSQLDRATSRRSSMTYDVLVRRNEAVDPGEGRGCRDEQHASSRVSGDQAVSVSSRSLSGSRTFSDGKTDQELSDAVLVYQNGGTGYVERSDISNERCTGSTSGRCFMASGSGTGNERTRMTHRILSKPIIAEPGTVCTETYLVHRPLRLGEPRPKASRPTCARGLFASCLAA